MTKLKELNLVVLAKCHLRACMVYFYNKQHRNINPWEGTTKTNVQYWYSNKLIYRNYAYTLLERDVLSSDSQAVE